MRLLKEWEPLRISKSQDVFNNIFRHIENYRRRSAGFCCNTFLSIIGRIKCCGKRIQCRKIGWYAGMQSVLSRGGLYICLAPKSDSSYEAYERAKQDAIKYDTAPIPLNIKAAYTKGKINPNAMYA